MVTKNAVFMRSVAFRKRLFKVQKRGDVKVSNVTCGYALSSAAIELPRIPAFYPKKTKKKTQQKEIPPLHH